MVKNDLNRKSNVKDIGKLHYFLEMSIVPIHGREKHIDIKCHYIREQVHNNLIELVNCRTDGMLVDMFTKGLS